MRPRLITIPISHYGERARWALDRAGVDYDEEHHLQMFSWVAALKNGGNKTLPILLTERGVLKDSRDIVHWASDRSVVPLFPPGPERVEVEALDDELAGDYGVAGRLVGYDAFFSALKTFLPYNAGRAPDRETKALSALRKPASLFAKQYLGVQPKAVEVAIDLVNRTMDRIADRLRDGRRYLFGNSFTAADLTFATMSAPNVSPERYAVTLPGPEEFPEKDARRIRAWREHPAGAFALRLFEERPPTRGSYERPLRVQPKR